VDVVPRELNSQLEIIEFWSWDRISVGVKARFLRNLSKFPRELMVRQSCVDLRLLYSENIENLIAT
jgi:hypothetical protein